MACSPQAKQISKLRMRQKLVQPYIARPGQQHQVKYVAMLCTPPHELVLKPWPGSAALPAHCQHCRGQACSCKSLEGLGRMQAEQASP